MNAVGEIGSPGVLRQEPVPQTFQEAAGEVLDAPEGVLDLFAHGLPDETPLLHELVEQVPDLEEDVEVFRGIPIFGIHVLQVEAAVLLGVEPLVLDLPPKPPGLIADPGRQGLVSSRICIRFFDDSFIDEGDEGPGEEA